MAKRSVARAKVTTGRDAKPDDDLKKILAEAVQAGLAPLAAAVAGFGRDLAAAVAGLGREVDDLLRAGRRDRGLPGKHEATKKARHLHFVREREREDGDA